MSRLALLLAVVLGLPFAAQAAQPSACPYPMATATAGVAVGSLPKLAAALAARRLDVVAVGSGSTMSVRGRPVGSFIDDMAQSLRASVPGLQITLTVQGERGLGSAAMLGLLRKQLAVHKAPLVIWQTGTVESVRKRPVADFTRDLDSGAEMVRAAGGELILVDPLYSRMLMEHANVGPYREAMAAAAQRHGAVLFSRFALLRRWTEMGLFEMEATPKSEQAQAADQRSRCLGQALAEVMLRAAGGS